MISKSILGPFGHAASWVIHYHTLPCPKNKAGNDLGRKNPAHSGKQLAKEIHQLYLKALSVVHCTSKIRTKTATISSFSLQQLKPGVSSISSLCI